MADWTPPISMGVRTNAGILIKGMVDHGRRAEAEAGHYESHGFLPARKRTLTYVRRMDEWFEVDTPEGTMTGHPGDYLAMGAFGEMYPIAAAIYGATMSVDAPDASLALVAGPTFSTVLSPDAKVLMSPDGLIPFGFHATHCGERPFTESRFVCNRDKDHPDLCDARSDDGKGCVSWVRRS